MKKGILGVILFVVIVTTLLTLDCYESREQSQYRLVCFSRGGVPVKVLGPYDEYACVVAR